jgi:hypothetical protein
MTSFLVAAALGDVQTFDANQSQLAASCAPLLAMRTHGCGWRDCMQTHPNNFAQTFETVLRKKPKASSQCSLQVRAAPQPQCCVASRPCLLAMLREEPRLQDVLLALLRGALESAAAKANDNGALERGPPEAGTAPGCGQLLGVSAAYAALTRCGYT